MGFPLPREGALSLQVNGLQESPTGSAPEPQQEDPGRYVCVPLDRPLDRPISLRAVQGLLPAHVHPDEGQCVRRGTQSILG